jgi:hypothetical protein
MALIEKKLVTERETASYKLDRRTVELVKYYAEFIDSPQEYVVNETLLLMFRKDKDFRDWLTANHKQVDLSKTESDNSAGSERTILTRDKASVGK